MRPPAPGRRFRPVFPPALSKVTNNKLCAGLVPVNYLSIQAQEYYNSIILFLYRGAFNVSIGLDEASCAGLWSRPYFVTPQFRLPLY